IAVGMTGVVVAGEIDLSVGSVLALAGCLAARLTVEGGWPVVPAVAAAVGAVAGAANGWLTVALGIPSFIITLGMMSVIRGATYVATQGLPINGLPDGFLRLGSGTVLGITVPVLTM